MDFWTAIGDTASAIGVGTFLWHIGRPLFKKLGGCGKRALYEIADFKTNRQPLLKKSYEFRKTGISATSGARVSIPLGLKMGILYLTHSDSDHIHPSNFLPILFKKT